MISKLEKNWYAIYTKSRNEKRVAGFLGEQGIEHYLPLIIKIKHWSDRRKKIEEPLFSSYVFVRITEKEHLMVLQTQGVVRFISFEGKKTRVRDIEIEAIKKFVESGEEFIPNESDFTPGKLVTIERGQFKGLKGRLTQILGKQRVKIEIEAIGQSIFLRIPLGSLKIENKD